MSIAKEPTEPAGTLLTNIVSLTEARDQFALEISLFQSLEEILRPQAIQVLEWVGGTGEPNIVYQNTALTPPPESLTSRLLETEPGFRHLGRLDDSDWISMDIEGKTAQDRRILVLGLKDWNHASLDIAKGMVTVYRNFMRLLNDSEKDTLTGLMNRRSLERHLADLLAARQHNRRVQDPGRGDYLAVLDIDHFKSVNDTYGHLIGDEVLLSFSNIMRQSVRSEDRCYRYGGEEFIVLLHDLERDQALRALERLRQNVELHTFPQVGHITVSSGFTRVEHQQVPPQIIEEADRALYYAKSHGRNQVQDFQALVAAGEISVANHTGSVELF